jgi:sodium/potassium-transporting ATPase subunit alpha
MDAPKDVEAGLPRAVTIDAPYRTGTSTGMGLPHTLSRHSTNNPAAAATRIPIEYRTLSQHVQDRDDLRVDARKGDKDKDKRKAVKGKRARFADARSVRLTHAADLASLDWHRISVAEILQRLSVSPNVGLDPTQVARRVEQYGKNQITPPKDNTLLKVLGWLFGGFGTLLLAASIVCFIAWYGASA